MVKDLLKEQWPKCSMHFLVLSGLSAAGSNRGKRGRESITLPFIFPGKVIQAEWLKSFSLDEIYKSKLQQPKLIPAPDNNFENHVI